MSAIYESSKVLAEYLLFHYGTPEEILPPGRPWPSGMREALGFPVRTVKHFSQEPVDRGLDLGCAVGRSSFEMANSCSHVTGIDFSHAFIHAADALRRGESIAYQRLDEGHCLTPLVATAPAGSDGERISFRQGDAMKLPEDLAGFDRVHAANLLCRLRHPLCLLERLAALVRPGGELVLATPATWLEEFTDPADWPPTTTRDWLIGQLGRDFELKRETEEPFLIRETARKFQWSSSLVTVWQRRVP